MKKKGEKIIGGFRFIPFSTFIEEQCKKPGFKKAYLQEIASVNIAFDLKRLRAKKRMTQKQVAAKADMPQSVIARMESGMHSFSVTTLQKVATVFDKQVGLVKQSRKRR
ncbi:MAG: hypothetical protein A2855_00955 [Candidatus Liptonbacteria bacterium RIFCSPHIGHO2_01_FULL_57_28]|uniref:HTH cro/C1-type domain-containing protein n=1 Tax=Candidatus Liptonbacteria bacterium RIFCSPHIGHO2_01_FULL_57_28 TaxID=1798647 RepID=A0A1G2C9J8_9BACT|nr:MAG: hypothetical protein A2855_00955 [Candidatus Liptonbacteria bacterium RIFCSPHIGHO2_01_FULL_57_28]